MSTANPEHCPQCDLPMLHYPAKDGAAERYWCPLDDYEIVDRTNLPMTRVSTPKPTHIDVIAEHRLRDWYPMTYRPVLKSWLCSCGFKDSVPMPCSSDDVKRAHAAHAVSKLTDAGYSIVPTPRVIHNQEEFDELPVRTWLRDSDGWVCQIGDDAESDPAWMAYPATVIWTPVAAEGEKP